MLHKHAEKGGEHYASKEKVHFFDVEIVFAHCAIVKNGAPYQHRGFCSDRERDAVARTSVQLFFGSINLYGELGIIDPFFDVIYDYGDDARVKVLKYRHY